MAEQRMADGQDGASEGVMEEGRPAEELQWAADGDGEHIVPVVGDRARLETLLQEASAQEVTYTDFLDRPLTKEVTAKREKCVAMCTAIALGLKAVQQGSRTLFTAALTLGSYTTAPNGQVHKATAAIGRRLSFPRLQPRATSGVCSGTSCSPA
jgi:hypothetical protein